MFSAAKTSGLTGYTLNRSLRFRSSATAYLTRTPSSTTNTTKFTWSGWVKRGQLGISGYLLLADNGTYYNFLKFDTTDKLTTGWSLSGGSYGIISNAVFRDPSAWYHVVYAVDTTQATAANREQLYVNGVLLSTTTQTSGYVSQNQGSYCNTSGIAMQIGSFTRVSNYFDGYISEINFIDGQALTPSSFGAYNAVTGVWQPIKYSGTYGTNGFYLNFNNNASTTTLGYDTSGNSNNWTTNNISLTAGVTYDSMLDVPTLTSATAANYAVLNPIFNPNGTVVTYSAANLQYSYSTPTGVANKATVQSSFALNSGKWYFEFTEGSPANAQVGISSGVLFSGNANGPNYVLYVSGSWNVSSATTPASPASFTTNDIIGVAFDVDNRTAQFFKNGVSQGTITAFESGLSWYPIVSVNTSASGGAGTFNFGQRPFSYTPPTGFVSLNTYNLPTPTIVNGAAHMAATKYTGTGTTQSINNGTNTTIGTTFQPDLVWMKSRSVTDYNLLVDSVRGVGKWLSSNATLAEVTADTNVLTSFNSNGFTVGADPQGSDAGWNPSGASQIAWQWKAGNGSSSNTNGSITSTVSVNAAAGFSVVTYTGTGANATVGHGLGVTPSMIITKKRNNTSQWAVYHASVGNTGALFLNTTGATTVNNIYWNNTSPTSNVWTMGGSDEGNTSGQTYVAYCWSAVAGFSKFGSYTGNGATDGPFVFTNFQPRWLMIKRTDSTSDWYIFDTTRDTYNVEAATLLADSSGVETSVASIDGLSNGFKCRSSTVVNVSGATYIYAAFASNPFRNSLAR